MNRRDFLTRISIAGVAMQAGPSFAKPSQNVVNPSGGPSGQLARRSTKPSESVAEAAGLLPDLTFDRFIEGTANQHARAIAFVYDSNPYSRRHPLCIYGAVGLGKTHLMQAIGHKVLDQDRHTRVKYVHVEDFFNQMVQSFQEGTLDKFRESYNSLDVLLLDDIQYLKHKSRTQEELLRILATLTQRNGLIVMTGDCLPQYASDANRIDAMDNDLLSAIHGGQPVDLYSPDLELRMNCLMAWAKWDGLAIGNDVMRYVAKRTRPGNMRVLQGAFTSLVAYARFHGEEISLATARRALRGVA